MRNLTPAQIRLVKLTIFTASLLPLILSIYRGIVGALGANPLEFITRATGDWTIYFLCLTLCITPLRRLTGWHWLQRMRRLCGLYVFFYAVLHFTCFLWFDHFFDLEAMFLFPWAVSFGQMTSMGFWTMMDFLLELTLGFVYVWKIGALNWT